MGLIENGKSHPIDTNCNLIPLFCKVDSKLNGFNPFITDFADHVREGNYDREEWEKIFDEMELPDWRREQTVNYKVADLTVQAVQSVLDSDSIGPVHVVVVDNSEDKDEAQKLRLNLPSGVVLQVAPENIGFGRACNLAFEQFPGELILLLNPDARLLPGCLVRLQKTLSSAENVAAVSPQIFLDEGFTFYLPPCYPPLLFIFKSVLATWGPQAKINRLQSTLWRRHSIKVWRSKRPVKVNNLPGGLVLLKRGPVLKAGGLFDPRFFLYFEDADLFVRLRKAGYSLIIDPSPGLRRFITMTSVDDRAWRKKERLWPGPTGYFWKNIVRVGDLA
jgi:GT2 family glycosyltransferase